MFTCGCPGDDATTAGDGTATDGTFGESAATSLTMTSTGTEGTDGLGSTGDSGTGSDEELDCPPVHVTLPNFDEALVVREWLDGEEHIDLADTGGLCDDLMSGPGALTTGEAWEILIFRPGLEGGTWPDGKWPLVVFQHGNGQVGGKLGEYDHLFRALAAEGFVVTSIDTPVLDSPERRASHVLCTTRWLTTLWAERDRLDCRLGLVGHSNGGAATVRAAQLLEDEGIPVSQLDLRALVGIASRNPIDGIEGDNAPHYLSLQSATDEQVLGGGVVTYDRIAPESTFAPSDPGKAMVWAYHVDHDAFGGGGTIENVAPLATQAEMVAKVRRWRVLT